MSEPPAAPPPPESPPPVPPTSVPPPSGPTGSPPPWPPAPPAVQPQYAVPSPTGSRWLGRGAVLYGMGAGSAVYLLGYVIAAAVTFAEPDEYSRQLAALASSVIAGGVASLLVLVAAIALIIIERTRAFGAGLAISMAIGILCGGGVCTTLVFATAG